MSSSATDDNPTGSVKRVAVIGAGVSGLAAAYKLKSHGVDVTVFEAEGRAGGRLRSVSRDGLIWDEGANTMTESEIEVKGLIDALGLQEKQQFPISQHKRYIVKNGAPVLVPTNPAALLKSNLLSAQSKMRHFFPELWNLEKRFGSVIAGALQSKFFDKKEKTGENKTALKKNKHKRGSFSFQGGMQTLTDTLCKELGKENLKLNSKVLTLAYGHDESSSSPNWSITCVSNQSTQDIDAVIMTAPLCNVKDIKITKRRIPFPLSFLPEISYVPISVMITAFRKENVKRPLEGFGVLVPSKERQNGLKTLGTLFSSMMFPDRAPSDFYLYTTFVGGTQNRELAQASTDELQKIVTSDLRKLLGAKGEPTFVNHIYWSKGFPLYGRNYGSVLEAIDKMEKDLPGFFFAGNQKGGLSVGKAISSGWQAADLVISYLNSVSDKSA
ncbi:protoporphyrinogen oxidase 2 isoform X4 [Vigna angularis]|uniref:protoporphyrinogen oxidase 2 isoform X4 n=1 Tax=Phaseolus angularis TaxID=3914 RepID=UPI0022B2EEC8|nr:protoporphyrinogen oxidase 2 isoform X4 [Vigna angularis]